MLIETHAHLDYPDFAPDFQDVVRRAEESGRDTDHYDRHFDREQRRAIELAENIQTCWPSLVFTRRPMIHQIIG